jgi:outer membrane receptor for ferrienterochelin and colicins
MNSTLSILRKAVRSMLVLRAVLGILVSLLLSAPLAAQSVDYGALEQLFNEPVTTSVDGSPQRVSDVPATMEIITAEDIRRSGAKDIPGVLRHVGGLDTLEWGNDDVDVSVRGYDQALAERLLVLVDGRQVYADHYGYTPWSTVPVELSQIRQIEIVKGPSCALFGFNAVGGVINIITFNPLDDKVNAVQFSAGTQGTTSGAMTATHALGDRAVGRITAGGDLDSDFSTPIPAAEITGPRVREHRGELNFTGLVHLTPKMLLEAEASGSLAQINEMGADYDIHDAKYTTESVQLKLTAETRFGLFQATAYTNWLTESVLPGVAGQNYHFRNRVTVTELHDIFKLGAHHTLRAAAEYRYDIESSTPTPGANVHYNDFAASGMWSWNITPSLSLTNALRVDHLLHGRNGVFLPGSPFSNATWERTFTEPNFNSGLVWRSNDADSVRITASRGTQIPSLVASGALLVITPQFIFTGSPLLKPTVVTNYEIGWDHAFTRLPLNFEGAAFHQHNQDLVGLSGGFLNTSAGPYYLPSNVGDSDANGLDLELRGTLRKSYRWGLNYRPEWISDHLVPAAQNGVAYIDFQHTTPVELVKADVGWTTAKWAIDGYLHYQSMTRALQPTARASTILIPVAGFVSLDARIAYNVANWLSGSVAGQNLTHASQLQTGGPAVERRVLGTMTFTF